MTIPMSLILKTFCVFADGRGLILIRSFSKVCYNDFMSEKYPLYIGNAFAVAPQSERFSMMPGEVKTGVIKITNPAGAENDVKYKIELSPYSIIDDKYTVDLKTENPYSDIIKWVTIDEPEGTIPPNTVKEVSYTIRVPEDVSGGGHYFAFLIKNMPSEAAEGVKTVQVKDVVELSSIVYATVFGETRYEGEILDLNVPIFSTSNPFYLSGSVINTGNIHQDASIKVAVENFFTGNIETVSSNVEIKTDSDTDDATASFLIMPDTSRYMNVGIYGLSDLGLYRVHAAISFNGKEYAKDTVLLMCPIWFIGIVLFAILATVGMIIRTVKTRKKMRGKRLW